MMPMNITLEENQVDKLLYILQQEIFRTEKDIAQFYRAGKTEVAEFVKETYQDETRMFNRLLEQFIDYRNQHVQEFQERNRQRLG